MSDATRSSQPRGGLDAFYSRIERSLKVRENADYEFLVTPNGNGMEPIHRWFHLKEAFSRRLLPRVLKDLKLDVHDGLSVLDPFAGSGTTPVALADLVRDGTLSRAAVVAYECNPFLHLVGSAKLRSLQAPSRTFLTAAMRVAAQVTRRQIEPAQLPELTTFHNDAYFEPDRLADLLRLSAAIEQTSSDDRASRLDVDLLRVCLGATVEPSSFLRRDGRALRHTPDKRPVSPVAEFLRRAEEIDTDMPRSVVRVKGEIHLGDARILSPMRPKARSIDLVLFSPPYPNNIDYTEVYKLEAWLLGYFNSASEFSAQRLKTLHSHPSIQRVDGSTLTTNDATWLQRFLEPLLEAVPSDRYCAQRTAMLNGYFADMIVTLSSCFDVLKPGGHLVYVVGNSAHGLGTSAVVVAADAVLAAIARHIGFDVLCVNVARRPKRRPVDSTYLRESVVMLRRPAAA